MQKESVLEKFSKNHFKTVAIQKNLKFLIEQIFSQLKHKNIILILLITLFAGFIISYIVTQSQMNFFNSEVMGINYVNTMDNLKKGRFDMDREVVGYGETYTRDSKVYMYFGVFPALFRGFIELFFKRGNTDWSRISVIIASMITFWTCLLAYYKMSFQAQASQRTRYFYTTLFALIILFGSPMTHIMASAYIYHEAISWGLAWGSLFICLFVFFQTSKKVNPVVLLFMSFCGGFGLMSRHTFGSPAIGQAFIILFLLASYIAVKRKNEKITLLLNRIGWNKPFLTDTNIKKVLVAAVIPLAITIGFDLIVNYKRWGNPLNFHADLKYFDNYKSSPWRLDGYYKSGLVNAWRIPHTLAYYLVPSEEHFFNQFPFVRISSDNFVLNKLRKSTFGKIGTVDWDVIEPGNPLIVHAFTLFILAIIGIFGFGCTYGVFGTFLIVPYIIQAISVLGFFAYSLRYSADFMPLLVICALASFKIVIDFENKSKKNKLFCRFFIVLITLIGIYSGVATMLQQKVYLWSVPGETKIAINSFYQKINNLTSFPTGLIGGGTYQIIRSDIKPENPKAGQLWVNDSIGVTFWYNGQYWLPVSDENNRFLGPITMKVKFNPSVGASEPLLSTGVQGSGNFVYVIYPTQGELQIGYDVWGSPGIKSQPYKIDFGKVHLLEISFGSFYPGFDLGKLSTNVIVKLDGKTFLDQAIGFHPSTLEQMEFGKNDIGGTSSRPVFTGQIEEVRKTGIQINSQ